MDDFAWKSERTDKDTEISLRLKIKII